MASLPAQTCGCRSQPRLYLFGIPHSRPQVPQSCPSRTTVQAAARRGGAGPRAGAARHRSKKGKQSDAAAQFEQLMLDWDDAFADFCEDTNTAAPLARMAHEGYQEHGRGFVFLRSELVKRSRGAEATAHKGFGAPPSPVERGTPLQTNPKLHLLSWTACYIPGSQLDQLGGVVTMQEGALVPDSSSVLAGSGGSASSDALGQLRLILRGQDLAQLRSYVGMPAYASSAASGGSSAGDASPAAVEATTMQGVRQYEPEGGELVVLLAAKIDGKPATGAELLVAARGDDGGIRLELPGGWEQLLAAA